MSVCVCVCFCNNTLCSKGFFWTNPQKPNVQISFQFHILCSRIALVPTFSHEVQFGPVWPFVTLDKGKILLGKVKVQGTNEMVIWERESARCFFWEEYLGRKMKRIDDKASTAMLMLVQQCTGRKVKFMLKTSSLLEIGWWQPWCNER